MLVKSFNHGHLHTFPQGPYLDKASENDDYVIALQATNMHIV